MNTVASAGKNPFRILIDFTSSSVGSKMLVALTGIMMWGFVIGHMVGHLQMFLPMPEGGYLGQQYNEYAHFLKTTPALLWGTRISLLGAIALHIFFVLRLSSQNAAARPVGYAAKAHQKSTLFSRHMRLTGIVVFAFIIIHLMHFTVPQPGFDIDALGVAARERPLFGFWQASHMGTDVAGLPNVYNSMRSAFSNIGWVVIYVIGNLLLIGHLIHGSQSVWQTLGLHNKEWARLFRLGGWALVAFIAATALALPLVLMSWYYLTGTA